MWKDSRRSCADGSVRLDRVGRFRIALGISSCFARAERIQIGIDTRLALGGVCTLAVAVVAASIASGRGGICSGIHATDSTGAAVAGSTAGRWLASLRMGARLSCCATDASATLAATAAAASHRTCSAARTWRFLLQRRLGLRIERARHDRGDDRDGGDQTISIVSAHDDP